MPTKKELQTHKGRLVDLGCIVCDRMGYPDSPASIHHIRDGYGIAQRAPDYEALPLCAAHHQTGGYGVAFHQGPAIWQDKYGTERELLRIVRELLLDQYGEVLLESGLVSSLDDCYGEP